MDKDTQKQIDAIKQDLQDMRDEFERGIKEISEEIENLKRKAKKAKNTIAGLTEEEIKRMTGG